MYLRVPRLWAYFALDQILPVSFTQNLFMIACQLVPTPEQIDTGQARPFKFRYAAVAIGSLYAWCLSGATLVVGSSSVFPILCATRATLLAPFLLAILAPDYREALLPSSIGMEGGLFQNSLPVVLGIFALFETKWKTWEVMSLSQAFEALNSNPAVSALGYDFLIGLASFIIHFTMHLVFARQTEASQRTTRDSQTKASN